jgi:hypothetical protein
MKLCITACLLLVFLTALADSEPWMRQSGRTDALAVQLVHGKQCPGTVQDALKSAHEVFRRHRMTPLNYEQSSDSLGIALRTFCGPPAGGVFLFKVDLFWTRKDAESGELMLYNKFYDRLGAGTESDLSTAIMGEVDQALGDYLEANRPRNGE